MEEKPKRKPIPKKLRFEIFKRDSFTCQYCGRMAPEVILEVDHILPVSKGGKNDIFNLVTSCCDCNRGKSNIIISDKAEIMLQKEQLKKMNEQKKQVQMMIEWKNELLLLEKEQVDAIESIFSYTGFKFSNSDKNKCISAIKKYGFEEVYESTQISFRQYYHDKYSFEKAIDYIFRICYVRKKEKENPFDCKFNHLKNVIKNEFGDYKRNEKVFNDFEKLINKWYIGNIDVAVDNIINHIKCMCSFEELEEYPICVDDLNTYHSQ